MIRAGIFCVTHILLSIAAPSLTNAWPSRVLNNGWQAFSSSIFNALRWEFPLVTTFPSDGKGNAHIINSFDICTWTFRDMISVFASTEWWLERWLKVLNAKSFPPLQFWHPHLDLLRHTPQCLIPLNDDSSKLADGSLTAKIFPPPLQPCLYFSA